MSRRSGAEKRSFWQMAVQMQQESGLSVATFCEREGLNATTFYGWRRKLQREASPACDDRNDDTNSRPPLDLIPVRIVQESPTAPVEIVSPDGLVVRVPAGAETENVRRILQLILPVA